jgi:hypothetical protein
MWWSKKTLHLVVLVCCTGLVCGMITPSIFNFIGDCLHDTFFTFGFWMGELSFLIANVLVVFLSLAAMWTLSIIAFLFIFVAWIFTNIFRIVFWMPAVVLSGFVQNVEHHSFLLNIGWPMCQGSALIFTVGCVLAYCESQPTLRQRLRWQCTIQYFFSMSIVVLGVLFVSFMCANICFYTVWLLFSQTE